MEYEGHLNPNTNISWNAEGSVHPSGLPIVDFEWENKRNNYEYGSHIVRLRVKSSDGEWSSWEEISFEIPLESIFEFTGEVHNWIVPQTGSYSLALWGAQGGHYGGRGGYAYGEIQLNEGEILQLYVGGEGEGFVFYSLGAGGGGKGGWNGGGNGGVSWDRWNRPSDDPLIRVSAGGVGATDIRVNGSSLEDRIIVAGGGGGSPFGHNHSGYTNLNHGIGGGLTGGEGIGYSISVVSGGEGGTQLSGGLRGGCVGGGRRTYHAPTNGVLGIGGTVEVWGDNAVGGGGGGGGGVTSAHGRGGGGGGGSSYVGDLLNGETTEGLREGNGLIKITIPK